MRVTFSAFRNTRMPARRMMLVGGLAFPESLALSFLSGRQVGCLPQGKPTCRHVFQYSFCSAARASSAVLYPMRINDSLSVEYAPTLLVGESSKIGDERPFLRDSPPTLYCIIGPFIWREPAISCFVNVRLMLIRLSDRPSCITWKPTALLHSA
jgi:hypothetical protein